MKHRFNYIEVIALRQEFIFQKLTKKGAENFHSYKMCLFCKLLLYLVSSYINHF